MKLRVSREVQDVHVPAIRFAESFARNRLRYWGYKQKWNITVSVKRYRNPWGIRGYAGSAYSPCKGSGVVRLRLAVAQQMLPHEHEYARFKNMPAFTLWNRIESTVYIAAHEFAHIIGFDGDKQGEIGACKFGYEAVIAWRDRQYDHPACII